MPGLIGRYQSAQLRRARTVWIDDYKLRAFAASFFDEGPEMNVVAVNIRAPRDNVTRMRKLFGLGSELDADHRLQAFFAGSGADAALQLRGAQAMEETAIHASAVERAERASVRVGQDGFGAVFGNDPAQAMGNFVESLVPGDALESVTRRGCGVAGRGRPALHNLRQWRDGRPRPSFPPGRRPFRLHPPHGVKHPIRRVHAVEILGNFGAKESAGNGVLGIALNSGGAAVFDGDQDAAGIRAVMRAGGVDDALHSQII